MAVWLPFSQAIVTSMTPIIPHSIVRSAFYSRKIFCKHGPNNEVLIHITFLLCPVFHACEVQEQASKTAQYSDHGPAGPSGMGVEVYMAH